MYASPLKAATLLAAAMSTSAFRIDTSDGKIDFQKSFTPQEKCYWSGTAPICAGSCMPGENTCGWDPCGDGQCCTFGTLKAFCCTGPCPNNELKKSSPGDEYCPPEKVILCPPGAEKNEDCICLERPDAGQGTKQGL